MLDRNAVAVVAARMGSSLLPDSAQWQNRFEVRSETSSRRYVIAQRKSDGSFGCSCMGWKSHRKCKHLTAVLPALTQAERQQAGRVGGR